MIISKRGEGMFMEILIAIIIGILILSGVFIFLFGNYIWDYVRGLPGPNYKYNNKDSPVKNITKDDVILASYYKVGVILDGKYIKLCNDGDCNNLRDSKLYLSGDDRSGSIYVDINWGLDKKIGRMVNSRFVIDSDIFSGKGVYESIKNYIPSYENLKNLDNSIYISGIFYRDKKYVVSPDERIFEAKFINMQGDDSSFGEKVKSLKVGENIIVYYDYFFGKIKTTSIQLERKKSDFIVFAYYLDSSGKEQYHQLNCNKNGWVGKNLAITNVKESLAETLDKSCKW